MKIRSVEFDGAIARPGAPSPRELTQIAFAGRSNVGKSSLINRVLGRTRTAVARVSATPGKTQEINFYRVQVELSSGNEREFHVVDLPGYGFAHVPMAVRAAWRPLIESFLSRSTHLAGVVQLVDMRHDPTDDDRRLIEYLASLGVPTLVVLTKADKLKASARAQREARTVDMLGLPREQVIPFSARTGEGRDALLGSMDDLLREGAQ